MLIIFDLDDTLIDTSGSIIPFKLKECLKLFIEKGLVIRDFKKAYEKLLAINVNSRKSEEALIQFVKEFGKDPSFVNPAKEEMTKPLPKGFSIRTTPKAKEILEYFQKNHILALVTAGYRPFQLEKLEKAGIDRSIFSNIATLENSIKKPFYEGLIQEFSVSPQDVIVCGDRVEMDLKPAYELGMQTVHMRWGRGKMTQTDDWVDNQISCLSELKRIVQT